jgi:hypothetical protein
LTLDFDLTISACRNNVGHIALIAAQQTLFIPAVNFTLNFFKKASGMGK